MIGHVATHRLGELAAGRITGRAAARIRVHLDDCARCHAAWERIRQARGGFADLAAAPAPELRWDRIRAQVYWSLGSGSYPVVRPPAARWPWLMLPALAATATALVWVAPWSSPAPRPPAVVAPAPPAAPSAIAVTLAPAPVLAVATFVEGDVTVRAAGATVDAVEPAAIGATPLGAGAQVTTGDGRLALQFGPASTVTLAPRSRLELRRFDAAAIELIVDGQVDLEVAHRAPGQRFAVIAGARTVEVRGTAFRVVHRDGEVAVACEHGRVAVSDADATVEVGAGQAVELDDDERLLGRAARPLSGAELSALLAARPPALAMWTDPATVLRTTGPLAVVAPRASAVRVDGVVVGAGPVWMRVPAGRHLVEAERAPGRFAPGRWIEVGTAPAGPLVLAADPPAPARGAAATKPDQTPAAARRARKAELTRALDQGRVRTCVRALAKQGIAEGTHVELEIGVDAGGALRFLNIAGTDLPARVADCVRDAVAATRLGAGPAATWRQRISF